MKKIVLINVFLFILANIQATTYISSASLKKCEFNGLMKIELALVSYGPLASPLNFYINFKGIEEISTYCMMDDFPTDALSEDPINNEFNTLTSDKGGLNSDSYNYVATCDTQSPKHGGIYFVEVAPDSNEVVEVREGVHLTFSPCLNQDEAEAKKDLSLSFRQANTFDLNSFSFMFYALTSQTINSDATIKLYFNFLDQYDTVLPSPVEANCTIEEPVTEIDESIGIAPAF